MKRKTKKIAKETAKIAAMAAIGTFIAWALLYQAETESVLQEKPAAVASACLFEEESKEPNTYYAVPLSEDLKNHIITVSESYWIDPAIVFAIIEKESNYNEQAIGDGGRSFGLMQIQERWHTDRMDKLGVTNLLDPYQNVIVGVDYLAELLYYYGDLDMALVAYNAGYGGAEKYWFSEGVYTSDYSESVMEIANRIKGVEM